MAVENNDWKLGLFVAVTAVVSFATLTLLGAARLDETKIYWVTHFDESVEGLELGSPVKFRGAPLGTVTEIGVAPDQRRVAVTFDVSVRRLNALGFDPQSHGDELPPVKGGGRVPGNRNHLPEKLAVQLASAGITGVKFLEIDFFDRPIRSGEEPVEDPRLLPRNYMPPAESTLKSLADWSIDTFQHAPDIAVKLESVLERADRVLEKVEADLQALDIASVGSAARSSMKELDATLVSVRTKADAIDTARLDAKATRALDLLEEALVDVRRLMRRVEQEGGLLSTVEDMAGQLDRDRTVVELKQTLVALRGAAESVDELAGGGDLASTLREVRGAAAALERVAEALERDPDMLLKGRSGGQE